MDQSFLNSFPSKIQDNNHPAAMSFVSPNVFSHQPTPTQTIPTSPFGNSHLANLPYGSPLGLSNVNSGLYNLNQLPQQQQQPPPTSPVMPQQQWSQNIPTIMPWSNTHIDNSLAPVDDKFSFASTTVSPSTINNQSNLNIPPISDNCQSSSAICDPLFNANSSSSSTSPLQHNFNNKNKRHFNQLMSETNDYEFDFDNSRPIKKYVCEDKVLEIFDRLHIREGEHYIVEDVVENGTTIKSATNTNHDLYIEEIDSNTGAVIELSPELKNAFKNNPQSLTDKLIASEQDKINKALVIWKPNDLTKLLGDSSTACQLDSDDDDDDDLDVRIEEALSDDEPDGMMSDFTSATQIEPYHEFQDQLME